MRDSNKVIEIHTSDRLNFRRCRRKWNWTSPMHGNLVLADSPSAGPLWLGSGFHFAMEDYHGWKRFDHPTDAFLAYVEAHRESQLPEDVDELIELGCSMLSYYADVWLQKPGREHYTTMSIGLTEPLVEFSWSIPLEGMQGPNGEDVNYVGTFDRVVFDSEDRIWVIDYKTAARLETGNLETDSQVSAYTWAARKLFGDRVEGVIWQQHLKKVARGPAKLKAGGFSQNKSAGVPWSLYRSALIEEFGGIPQEYVEHLNSLLEEETEQGDAFVKQQLIRRSPESSLNFEKYMRMEVSDMVSGPQIYPNPTRDCAWDCPVRTACITLEDGYDWELILGENFVKRTNETNWRDRIKWPSVELESSHI